MLKNLVNLLLSVWDFFLLPVLFLCFCIQWKLGITRSMGPKNCVSYIRYFVISVVNKQYKTKEINSLGPEK